MHSKPTSTATATRQTGPLRKLLALAVLGACAPAALADITIGVSLPLTGAASSLGIPIAAQVKLWPAQIGGEKLNVLLMDDATDVSKGVDNARRFVESKADVVLGSIVTPVAAAMAQHLNEAQTPQFALGPIVLPAGKDAWSFRLPQSTGLVAAMMLEHMKKANVKTIGFLGYADAFGEGWLTEVNALLAKPGAPKLVGVERFARTDSSVASQALKLTSANPDAILVVASGGGAALPQKALIERGYKGRIYQTHAAASRDFLRLSGKDAEGAFVAAAPSIVPDQLPASHPSKAAATDYVQKYEAANGAGSRAIFAASAYDFAVILDKALPAALKAGKPGTQAFRTGLRDAFEQIGPTPMSNGVMNFTRDDHWGHTSQSIVMLKVSGGDWKVEP
jgi:branched-chain amino acid transport system substrate-binding protein